jgi:hypothetical protein
MADSIRHAIVPAHATDERSPEPVAVTPPASPPSPVERSAAQLADDDDAMRKYREQEKLQKIFADAPAQIEAARKKGREELDAWLLENARQAKRDEDERLAKLYHRSQT